MGKFNKCDLSQPNSLETSNFQVHHSVVHGRCHLNVSAVMKKAPSDHNVRIVALRHDHSEDNGGGVAIENFNRFPEVIENNVRANFAPLIVVFLSQNSFTRCIFFVEHL